MKWLKMIQIGTGMEGGRADHTVVLRATLSLTLCFALGLGRVVAAETAAKDVLTLAEALQLADARAIAIEMAREDVKAASGQIMEARATALPRLELHGQYARLDAVPTVRLGGAPITMGNQDNYEASVDVSQILYAGGGVRAAVNLAKEYEEVAAAQLLQARLVTAYNVHAAFNHTLLAREHARVAGQSLELAQRNLANVQAREREGIATRFDRIRAEAQISQREADHIGAGNAVHKAQLALFRLLELPLDAARTVDGTLSGTCVYTPPADPVSLARARRPDIALAQRWLAVQREALRLAQSGARPTIAAFGQYKQANPDRAFDNRWEDSWTIGIRAELPLFDGGETRGRVRQARAKLRQAEHRYESTLAQARLEIALAEADLTTAQRLLEAEAKHVAESQEALRLAQRSYEQGILEQIDVISAQVALANSQRRHAAAAFECTMARRALDRATGTLLERAGQE